MSTDILIKIKNEIDEAKQNLAMEKGKLQTLYETLHTEFGVKTLKEAQNLLEEMDEKLSIKLTQYDEALKVLESKYDWDFKSE